MYNASLYHRANEIQRQDASDVMDEFGSVMQWREDGEDTLLDIGCGPGDVTIDFVLPKMPKNFKKLVGCDVSEVMLQHARMSFERPNISFEKLDIGGDTREFLENYPERFDHITSFYCLHWVRNQKKAVKNIYDLLNSTGDCVLLMLAAHPFYSIYKKLARTEKWATIMKKSDMVVSPFENIDNPSTEYDDLLRMAGFSNCDVRNVDRVYIYDELSIFKSNTMAINPFLAHMTIEQQDEYFEDFLSMLVQKGIAQRKENGKDFRVVLEYKLLIAYANK